MEITGKHWCKKIAGRAQKIVKASEFMGNQGSQVWHLVPPTLNLPTIFIINFCPFCGQKLK